MFCEAAFDARYIHNYHILLVKDGGALINGHTANGHTAASFTSATTTTTTSDGASGPLAASLLPTSAQALVQELPSDPVTQLLMALYFFLAGLLVGRGPHMWLLPAASFAMALVAAAAHVASQALVPSYRFLTPERRALWCSDIAHLGYSACVSAASLAYAFHEPRALQLTNQPADITLPSIITAVSAGEHWRSASFPDAAARRCRDGLETELLGMDMNPPGGSRVAHVRDGLPAPPPCFRRPNPQPLAFHHTAIA